MTAGLVDTGSAVAGPWKKMVRKVRKLAVLLWVRSESCAL
jgi:hypothetical protein